MDALRLGTLLGLGLLLATGRSTSALIPGGQARRTDCLAEWRVTTRSVPASQGRGVLDCQDGDPSCDADGREDGSCSFNVSVCILERDPSRPECTAPGALTGFRRLSTGLEPPRSLSGPGCGRATPFRATLRTGRKGHRPSSRLRLRMTAESQGIRDVDRLAIRCLPAPTTCPAATDCPPLVLTAIGQGSDLDLGWTGLGHNFSVANGSTLQVCLEGCDHAKNPRCDTRIVTGAGTANGTLFGPPLPLAAAGAPICLVREYAAAVFSGGTANLQTGALAATIGLRARFYLGTPEHICPPCTAGRCEGGANDGGACTADARLPVPGVDGATLDVSRDCRPSEDTLAGSAEVQVPLTTDSSVLAPPPGGDGTEPSGAQPGESIGVPPQASRCVDACDATCTGDACASEVRDPSTGQVVCEDVRGGQSQRCCMDDSTLPCFPSPLERTGLAMRPTPFWPGPVYPKENHLVGVATFCQGATGTDTTDASLGLPGPGAIIFPAAARWETPLPCDGGDGGGGGAPAPY
jgi:hypothetical protein